MNVVWKKFCRTLAGFRTARGGNVAITFALATLPILGFVGAAVDYSRANSVKAAMQTALDSTALMLSKEAVTDSGRSVEDQRAEIFHRDVREAGSQGHPGHREPTPRRADPRSWSAHCTMPADFTKILGFDTFNLVASSTCQVGHKPAARCARARQHGINGGRRKDGLR